MACRARHAQWPAGSVRLACLGWLISILCLGLVCRNWPYLQACLQAGEVVIPQSGYVTVLVL
jgi:hypothetical protein